MTCTDGILITVLSVGIGIGVVLTFVGIAVGCRLDLWHSTKGSR